MDKNLHDIDALFTENLEGETTQPSAHVWDAIEAGLNQRDLKTMRGKNRRLQWLSALLVLLLTTSLVWLYQTRSKQSAGTASTKGNTIAAATNNSATELAADTKHITTTPNSPSDPHATVGPNNTANDITTAPLAQDPSQSPDKQGRKDQAIQSDDKLDKPVPNTILKPTKPNLPSNMQNPLTVHNQTAIHKINKSKNLSARPNRGTLQDATLVDANDPQADKSVATGRRPKNKSDKRLQTTIRPASATTDGDKTIALANEGALGYELPPMITGPAATLDKPSLSKLLALQSANGPKLSTQLQKQHSKSKLSFSIAPYYALNWFTAKVGNGRPQHREDNRDDIKQREQPNNHSSEPSYGLLATASFNGRWALQTGLGLVSIDNNINSHTLFARQHQQPGGGTQQSAGFKFNCTAGTVYFDSKLINANPNVGDSLVALQSSSRLQYLQVPISLRYTFINKGALQLYGITGVTANLLTRGQVTATISNGSIKEDVSSNSINGLSKLYWGLHIGAGVEYKMSNRLGVYFAPSYSFGITPINKETPVSTRLGQLSLMGGLRLRLGRQ